MKKRKEEKKVSHKIESNINDVNVMQYKCNAVVGKLVK